MAQWPLFRIISTISVAFGANYIKVVEDRPIVSGTKVWPKESSF